MKVTDMWRSGQRPTVSFEFFPARSEKQAVTLADRGTYYAFALSKPPKVSLVILLEGHKDLHNPYGVIAVNPKRHPHVNFEAAKKYIEWLTSPRIQRKIGQYKFQGKVLFHPLTESAKAD